MFDIQVTASQYATLPKLMRGMQSILRGMSKVNTWHVSCHSLVRQKASIDINLNNLPVGDMR